MPQKCKEFPIIEKNFKMKVELPFKHFKKKKKKIMKVFYKC